MTSRVLRHAYRVQRIMRYSQDRINHLAHKIHDRLYLDEDVDYTDEDRALDAIKKVMLDFLQLEDKIDQIVQNKILTLKRNVIPGSREWNILYLKYFEEELRRQK